MLCLRLPNKFLAVKASFLPVTVLFPVHSVSHYIIPATMLHLLLGNVVPPPAKNVLVLVCNADVLQTYIAQHFLVPLSPLATCIYKQLLCNLSAELIGWWGLGHHLEQEEMEARESDKSGVVTTRGTAVTTIFAESVDGFLRSTVDILEA